MEMKNGARLQNLRMLRLAAASTVILFLVPWAVSLADSPNKTEANPGYFFSVEGAKDCAFDPSRDRLYVTTSKQLVVLNTKTHEALEPIDLPGDLQAIDISPDFKYLAVGPKQGQFIYWISLIRQR